MTYIHDRKELLEYLQMTMGDDLINHHNSENWIENVLEQEEPTIYPLFMYCKKIPITRHLYGLDSKYGNVKGEHHYKFSYVYEPEIVGWVNGLEKEKADRDGQLEILKQCLEKLRNPEATERNSIIL